jgi:hypothetical protein
MTVPGHDGLSVNARRVASAEALSPTTKVRGPRRALGHNTMVPGHRRGRRSGGQYGRSGGPDSRSGRPDSRLGRQDGRSSGGQDSRPGGPDNRSGRQDGRSGEQVGRSGGQDGRSGGPDSLSGGPDSLSGGPDSLSGRQDGRSGRQEDRTAAWTVHRVLRRRRVVSEMPRRGGKTETTHKCRALALISDPLVSPAGAFRTSG